MGAAYRAVAQTNKLGLNGEKSVSLKDLGIRKNSAEFKELAEVFSRKDDGSFNNAIYENRPTRAVIWSSKRAGKNPGNSIIELIKNK